MQPADYIALRQVRIYGRNALASALAMIPILRGVFYGPMAVAIIGRLVVCAPLIVLFLPAL